MQVPVVRHQFLHLCISAENVFRIAGERGPAERADAAAKERTDIGGHETGKVEGVSDAHLLCHLADVVAVVKRRHAAAPELEHGAHVNGHRLLRRRLDALRVAVAARVPVAERPTRGQIAGDRIMRGGLVGHDIGPYPTPHELGQHLGRVAEQADGDRLAHAARALDHG